MSESKIIEIIGVTSGRASDINLCVEQKACVLLSGEPGAGKTTLLKMMNGLVEPDQGRVLLFNQDIKSLSQYRLLALRQFVSYLGFPRGLVENWTGYQNLCLPLKYHWNMDDHACDKRIRETEVYLGPVRELLGYPVSWLDNEAQRFLTVFRSLVIRPRLLLLDPDEMKLSKPGLLESILGYLFDTQTTAVIADSIYLKNCHMDRFRRFDLYSAGGTP